MYQPSDPKNYSYFANYQNSSISIDKFYYCVAELCPKNRI